MGLPLTIRIELGAKKCRFHFKQYDAIMIYYIMMQHVNLKHAVFPSSANYAEIMQHSRTFTECSKRNTKGSEQLVKRDIHHKQQ